MAEAAIDPLVAKFAEYATQDANLNGVLDAYCQENCAAFAGNEFEGEHTLAMTEIHKVYLQLMEQQLETFLAQEGVSNELLAAKLSEVASADYTGEGFVPQLITNIEYETFFAMMAQRWQVAQASVAQASIGGISGHWTLDTSRIDTGRLDMFMQSIGCPWVFRKLFAQVATNGQQLFANHNDLACELSWKLPFLGARVESFNLDAVPMQRKNLWRAIRVITAWQDENRTVWMKTEGNTALGPGGYSQISFSLDPADPQTLLYSMTAVFGDGRPPVDNVLCFRRTE